MGSSSSRSSFRRRVLDLTEAGLFIYQHHSHHDAPQGHKFSTGCERDGELVGVVVVGRPVNRHMDNGTTLEVTRLCTKRDKNVGSFLLGCVRRAALNMGYSKLISYILESEDGAVYRAAGWHPEATTHGHHDWDSSRRGRQVVFPGMERRRPTEPKVRWALDLA